MYDDIDWQGEYEALRDAIIEQFNPQDGEAAEVSILIDAVNEAGAALRELRARVKELTGDEDVKC